jgi:hypothetical protein
MFNRILDAGHHILAVDDLWIHLRFSRQQFSRSQIAQIQRHGRRTNIHRSAVTILHIPGLDVDHFLILPHRDGHVPFCFAQRFRQRPQTLIINGQVMPAREVGIGAAYQRHRCFQSFGKPLPVRDRTLQVWRCQGDEIFADRRFDFDCAFPGALADDLFVAPALFRDIDKHVAADLALTGEAHLSYFPAFVLEQSGPA